MLTAQVLEPCPHCLPSLQYAAFSCATFVIASVQDEMKTINKDICKGTLLLVLLFSQEEVNKEEPVQSPAVLTALSETAAVMLPLKSVTAV